MENLLATARSSVALCVPLASAQIANYPHLRPTTIAAKHLDVDAASAKTLGATCVNRCGNDNRSYRLLPCFSNFIHRRQTIHHTTRITNPCTHAAIGCSIVETITPPLGDG
jgi:hypothetical protein